MTSQFALIIISLLIALGGFGLYLWASKTGQFDDAEETKYQVFDDDDEDDSDSTPDSKEKGT